MATRDRTTEFLDKRKSEYRGGAEKRPSEALQDPLLDYSGRIDTAPISGGNVPMHVTFSHEIQSSLNVLSGQSMCIRCHLFCILLPKSLQNL